MNRVCRIIPNFVSGMSKDTLWRLCASSRMANHRSVFHSCKQFQEKDNLFSKDVNDSSKDVNDSSKATVNYISKKVKNCQPKSGKDK